jgi:hypothetical protein
MIWTVAVLRGHEPYSAITFARQAWLIRHIEKALLVERRLDLGLRAGERLERIRAPDDQRRRCTRRRSAQRRPRGRRQAHRIRGDADPA